MEWSYSRRRFVAASMMTIGGSVLPSWQSAWAADAADPRVSEIVAKTIGIDTHNHIDVPLTAAEMPGPDIDFRGEIKRSGFSAICMAFATDYQTGDAYDRFRKGFAAMDRQLERNEMKRSLSAADVREAKAKGQPAVIQAIEGGHFLQGQLGRVEEAYKLGLRHFGLLHDSDASVPLGDVYTNKPVLGGLTSFGQAVIKECNRLGILIDLEHASAQMTEMALKVSTSPIVLSHTGLDTQLGGDPRMAQMMRPRLISREQARRVAAAGNVIGVWTHLSDTPLDYAKNIRAMVDVVGVDHVCIGTDTKLTTPTPRRNGPPPGGSGPDSGGGRPGDAGPGGEGHAGPPPGGPRSDQQHRFGERTNQVWEQQTTGFYSTVVNAMLKTGFSAEDIGKIGGDNYLRIFAQSAK